MGFISIGRQAFHLDGEATNRTSINVGRNSASKPLLENVPMFRGKEGQWEKGISTGARKVFLE